MVAFRAVLAAGDDLRNTLLDWAYGAPSWGWLLPVAFGITGATLAAMLVRRYAPETKGIAGRPGTLWLPPPNPYTA
ncbi:MAG TPA: hypothetical protein VFU22_08160 [Roseiflexaceae bacterium]|nr:hypothetical protein [Roseiflexaceae bacterium]